MLKWFEVWSQSPCYHLSDFSRMLQDTHQLFSKIASVPIFRCAHIPILVTFLIRCTHLCLAVPILSVKGSMFSLYEHKTIGKMSIKGVVGEIVFWHAELSSWIRSRTKQNHIFQDHQLYLLLKWHKRSQSHLDTVK